jgi:hypothetical protein
MFRDLRCFQQQKEIAVKALIKLKEKAYLTEYAQGVVDEALKEIEKIGA